MMDHILVKTLISSRNKDGVNTFIKYDFDKTLDIKEEIIQEFSDPEPVAAHEENEPIESKFCTVYVREDEIFAVKPKMHTHKKQKTEESNPEKKYKCIKCARGYTNKGNLTSHQKYECDVKSQFLCKFCNKQFAHKSHMIRHVGLLDIKKSSQASETSRLHFFFSRKFGRTRENSRIRCVVDNTNSLSEDQHSFKRQSKKSIVADEDGPYSCTTTHISSDNKSGAKTLIEYDMDQTLDIKEEINPELGTITAEKGNKRNKSTFCSVYVREDEILAVKPKLLTHKKHKIHESKPKKKYTCEKCSRTYTRNQGSGILASYSGLDILQHSSNSIPLESMQANVKVCRNRIKKPYLCQQCGRGFALKRTKNRHMKHECGKMPMFQCPFCGLRSKQTSPIYAHIRRKHPGMEVYVVDLRQKM
ncbi:gastrula zinc finger protein XlCGF57.1-like [Belonocnema kinseyi]|uniref:gastrula zinc finger protein XlCGF57.1-like n=1 Tax=Belonocnema kinseyi TaxID=2817044 RepID=UPI00143D28DD|nr:gastrula zinc finger protein XlCGF57.1-like [Belonocnema kinseyi]